VEDHIGARIGYWRKRRGLTQSVLPVSPGCPGRSFPRSRWGRKGVERRATLVALAEALRVSVADLLGQPGDPTDPAKDGVSRLVPTVRLALIEPEAQPDPAEPGRRPRDDQTVGNDHPGGYPR